MEKHDESNEFSILPAPTSMKLHHQDDAPTKITTRLIQSIRQSTHFTNMTPMFISSAQNPTDEPNERHNEAADCYFNSN